MNTLNKTPLVNLMRTHILPLVTTAVLATSLALLATSLISSEAKAANSGLTDTANSISTDGSTKLLTANFTSRSVVQVEAGDFHFKPGQVAPIHTHSAPAIGYVAKGSIIYQIEGEKPQILNAGDAFYEPVGPRILRFDYASATKEAIFIDFNLEQAGEPFIVFEKPLTEKIDRRTLPTVKLDGQNIDHAEIYANELKPAGIFNLANNEPTLGLVAEGVVELRLEGKPLQRIVAGGTFALPKADSRATLVNASSEAKANVITFRLK